MCMPTLTLVHFQYEKEHNQIGKYRVMMVRGVLGHVNLGSSGKHI